MSDLPGFLYTEDREAFEGMVERVVHVAARSPCAKSKRGVVVWRPGESVVLGEGFNTPPSGFACDGSNACRAGCGKVCLHAEQVAIAEVLRCGAYARPMHLMHVKVVDGEAVPSGPPSCWQCSRAILHAGIGLVWLLHENGWTGYSAAHFHERTLRPTRREGPVMVEEITARIARHAVAFVDADDRKREAYARRDCEHAEPGEPEVGYAGREPCWASLHTKFLDYCPRCAKRAADLSVARTDRMNARRRLWRAVARRNG